MVLAATAVPDSEQEASQGLVRVRLRPQDHGSYQLHLAVSERTASTGVGRRDTASTFLPVAPPLEVWVGADNGVAAQPTTVLSIPQQLCAGPASPISLNARLKAKRNKIEDNL